MSTNDEGRESLVERSRPISKNYCLNVGNLPQPNPDEQQIICAVCAAPRSDDLIGADPERCDHCLAYRPPPAAELAGAVVYRFPGSRARREVRYAKAA